MLITSYDVVKSGVTVNGNGFIITPNSVDYSKSYYTKNDFAIHGIESVLIGQPTNAPFDKAVRSIIEKQVSNNASSTMEMLGLELSTKIEWDNPEHIKLYLGHITNLVKSYCVAWRILYQHFDNYHTPVLATMSRYYFETSNGMFYVPIETSLSYCSFDIAKQIGEQITKAIANAEIEI